MNATLKDIAAAAGVSVRSVTRALKNETGGSEKTYKKILAIADSLGYYPNIAARNLRTQRNNIVGIFVPPKGPDVLIRKSLYLQRALKQENIFPLLGVLPKHGKELRSILLSWTGLVKTVIFYWWSLESPPEEVLADLPMRFIFVDCSVKVDAYNQISLDRSLGIKDAVISLFANGNVNVARVGSKMQNRIEGFANAYAATGRELPKNLVLTSKHLEFEDGYLAGDWLVQNKIEAVFFDTDRMALGFLKYAFERKLRIPDEIAVVGFDDDPASHYACPALSTVAHPLEEMTAKTMEFILNEKTNWRIITLPTRFIQRESG